MCDCSGTGGELTGEWWERKGRSEALLRARGVPINDWLPIIGEGDEDKKLRTPREVAERAVALCPELFMKLGGAKSLN